MAVLATFLQAVAAWIFGFVLVSMLGIGNGAEIVAIPLAMAFAIWAIGGMFDRRLATGPVFWRITLAAFVGALIMATGWLRILGIFLPMIFGIVTYRALARRR